MGNNLNASIQVLAGGAGAGVGTDVRLYGGPITIRYVGAVGDKIRVDVSAENSRWVADIERTVQTVDDGELCFVVEVADPNVGGLPIDYNYVRMEVVSGNAGATATASATGEPRTTNKPTAALTVNNDATPGAYADCRGIGGPRTILYEGFSGDAVYLEGSDDGLAEPFAVYPAGGATTRTGGNWAAVIDVIPNYMRLTRSSGTTAGARCGVVGPDNAPGGGGGGSGPLVLDSLAVGDTAVNGPIGALTAAESVDLYAAFVLTQTTASVTATLPTPTINNRKVVTVANAAASTQPIVMYGIVIGPGYFSTFEWNGTAWVGMGYLTLGGNAYATAIRVGSLDAQNVSLVRNNVDLVQLDGTTVVLLPQGAGAGGGGAWALRELAANGTNQVRLRAPDALAADVNLVAPEADGVAGAPSVLETDGAGSLSFRQLQSGTSSIGGAGVSVAIAANITADTRIVFGMVDFVASTAVGLEAKAADRVVGTPGSFIVTAYDAAGAAVAGANGTTFDWWAIG